MPGATKRKTKPLDTQRSSSETGGPYSSDKDHYYLLSFPYAQYSSLLGTQSLLLIFSALYLPRSTTHLFGQSFLPEQQTSKDRPQHQFLQPLTASPGLSLAWICLGVGLVIPWWAGYMRIWAREEAHAKVDSSEKALSVSDTKMKSLREAWITTFLGVPIFYGVLVLFGAPISSHFAHTSLFSILLSFLTVYTPSYALGVPSQSSEPSAVASRLKYTQLFSEFRIRRPAERAIVYPIVGVLVGSLVGAFPLPLDWDRPWQAWPLTPAFGAIVGYILASAVSLAVNTVFYLASFDRTSSS